MKILGRKKASAIFKFSLATVCLIDFVVLCSATEGVADISFLMSFSAFSLAASAIYFAMAGIYMLRNTGTRRKTVLWPCIKGFVTAASLFSAVFVSMTSLSRVQVNDDSLGGLGIIVIVPALMVVDWLFFDRKGKQRAWWPPLWTGVFLILVCVKGAIVLLGGGGSESLGVVVSGGAWSIIPVIALLIALFILCGYVVFFCDRIYFHIKSANPKVKNVD